MAYEHNIQWVPHGWKTTIGLAADVHPLAAIPVVCYLIDLTPGVNLDGLITELSSRMPRAIGPSRRSRGWELS